MKDEESKELIIHIDWSGPHTLKSVASLNGPSDYGIYQIYGRHLVYGSDVLLYIGRAVGQTFAARLAQETEQWSNNSDAGRVEIYTGRLWGLTQPDDEDWDSRIRLAEKLLIYVHEPAQNTQKEIKGCEAELKRVRIVNWHCHRDLLPEVSGVSWTGFTDWQAYRHFGAPDISPPNTPSP